MQRELNHEIWDLPETHWLQDGRGAYVCRNLPGGSAHTVSSAKRCSRDDSWWVKGEEVIRHTWNSCYKWGKNKYFLSVCLLGLCSPFILRVHVCVEEGRGMGIFWQEYNKYLLVFQQDDDMIQLSSILSIKLHISSRCR